MSRKAWLQLVLPLIGLSVLFWLLAFAPGEKHHQPPLLELSVILRDGDGAVSTMRKGMEPQDIIEFAVAASCLKQTIEHDFNLCSEKEVLALMGGNASGRVQR